MRLSHLTSEHAVVFGISIGMTLLSLSVLLLIFVADQTNYLLTFFGLLCSGMSMLLICGDLRNARKGSIPSGLKFNPKPGRFN